MELQKIQDANIKNRRALVRCGFDVPFDDQGDIAANDRIEECIPTIKYLISQQAMVILCGHNGRPKGEIVPKLSMDKVAVVLEEYLSQSVTKLDDCVGQEVQNAVDKMKPGEVVLLENLRFHKEERENNKDFAKQLSVLADIYVNEAFSNSHRGHASMTGVTEFIPGYAGLRLQKEVEVLSGIIDKPARPFVAVIGGAKISDKIKVIQKFLKTADHILLGGALANTILKAKGLSIGKSLVEENMMQTAKNLPLTDTRFHVPVDVVTALAISQSAETSIKAVGNVSDNEYILDIGPDTVKLYKSVLKEAQTIVWGGPMGYFELDQFAKGTEQVAKIICKTKATSIVGGGDTVEALSKAKCKDKITFISTGGGAMLEFLEGRVLPAIKPLIKK